MEVGLSLEGPAVTSEIINPDNEVFATFYDDGTAKFVYGHLNAFFQKQGLRDRESGELIRAVKGPQGLSFQQEYLDTVYLRLKEQGYTLKKYMPVR